MLAIAGALILTLASCVSALAQGPEKPDATTSGPQVIKMTAKKYVFDPATITVTRGRLVRIEATALDRDHGIEIKEFGINTRLEKGKMTVIEFTPDKTGDFTFHCSVFCGLGHHGMKGRLVVVEQANP